MNKKLKKIFGRLDNKSLLIGFLLSTAAVALVVFSVSYLQNKSRIQTDYKKPLSIRSLEYCNNGEKLDLFVPQSNQPVPLVIYIHGGGWKYGSKVGGSENLFTPLLQKNIAVASINYRLSDSAKFPAAIQDVLCSVRFLKSNASVFNINPDKVGLAGISAGAHLAALAGNNYEEASFGSQEYTGVSNEVKAVVAINGIFDLNDTDLTVETQANVKNLLKNNSELERQLASPITKVGDQSPPQLIIYSSSDKLVNPAQSLNYYKKARQTKVEIQLLKVDSADHNLGAYRSLATRPNRSEIEKVINDFFINALR